MTTERLPSCASRRGTPVANDRGDHCCSASTGRRPDQARRVAGRSTHRARPERPSAPPGAAGAAPLRGQFRRHQRDRHGHMGRQGAGRHRPVRDHRRHRSAQWSLVLGDRAYRRKEMLQESCLRLFDWAYDVECFEKVSNRVAATKLVLVHLLERWASAARAASAARCCWPMAAAARTRSFSAC